MTTRVSPISMVRYGMGCAAVAALAWGLLEAADPGPVMLLASAFLCLITCTDTLGGRIPNLVTLPLLAGAFLYHLVQSGPAGLLFALLGSLTGFALLFLPFLLLGMGGGDVKALAALGALLGPGDIFQVFLLTGLIGGLLSLLYMGTGGVLGERLQAGLAALKTAAYCKCLPARGQGEGPRLRVPYAPAITLGYFAFVRWGGIV